VRTLEISNDRRFDEKLIYVVGLYLNPPDKAVVLCMDEKSQTEALDRMQPPLPFEEGPGRNHDPRRQAQRDNDPVRRAECADRSVVIGHCLPRHRNGEFLKFLGTIDQQIPMRSPTVFQPRATLVWQRRNRAWESHTQLRSMPLLPA
jgi:hypothetical protein